MKKRILLLSLLLSILFFQSSLFSQQFSLLKDINESPTWSSTVGPRNMIAVNDLLFFRQDTGLWRTDGTPGGTIFLEKITPDKMINVNNTLFVTRSLFDFGGGGVWKSDGTPEGTIPINYISDDNWTSVNSTLYFTKDDGITGHELWKSDGTEAGTVMVKDITQGPNGSSLGNLVNVNGTLFFNVGGALWKSDGTDAGTILVKNNITLSHPFALPSGHLYFVNNGNELWKSDGTDAGTVFIKQISTASPINSSPQFTFVNGTVFFIGNLGTVEAALWKSDGTEPGTALVKDITPQYDGIGSLVNLNDILFFAAVDGIDGGALWKSDGTETGTVMVKNSIGVGFLTPVNGVLLFANNDGIKGQELWKSDGTAAGTVLVKDIYEGSGSSNPFITDVRAFEPLGGLGYGVVNNTLFFSAANGLNGRELWKSDGTAARTMMVKDIYTPNVSSNARYFTKVKGIIYFTANDRFSSPFYIIRDELFKTDGTLSGTDLVRDLFGLGSSFPNQLTNFKDTVYFSATDGLGYELFKSDGTYNGTIKVKDINPSTVGQIGSTPLNLTPINNLLFFSATDDINGYELWKTNGSEEGTIMVKNINPAANSSDPSNLVNVNGTLFFSADDGINGKELWKSDGTEAGTIMIKNINGSGSSNPAYLKAINDTLYFTADDGSNGIELWRSDGSEAGTVLIKNINAGINNSSPAMLTNINGVLYFVADDGSHGIEVWKSDGTGAGTVLIKDIYNGPASSFPASFTLINSSIFFSAEDGIAGRELWKSDGSADGTIMIRDILSGTTGSNPTVLTKMGNNLMFAADDGTHGNEIWISNGAEAGTRMMQDLEPGIVGSDPSEFIEVNGKVLASVFTSYFGREIWVADVPSDIPLPLEFLEFKGSIVNNDGVLNWKTENENNTNLFIVERSTGGSSYKMVGSVTAANSPGIHYYNFTDVDIVSLAAPIVYYRLKQTDIDGRFTYSNIVTLAIDNKKSFVMLYLNPVKNKINLAINVPQKEKMQWQLTDNTGRTVKKGVYDLSPGSTAVSIDILNLSSGIYFMRLNGSTLQQVLKIIKQ